MYEPGSLVVGKYRVERVLGEGGMGTVVAATHVHLGTQVALKCLHEDLVKHASVVERFLREARASAQLTSDHVCRVSDVATDERGTPFIVMELLHGNDLAALLKAHGAMPAATVAEYLLQALHAIAEAHSRGIVHRDLKPGNLFLAQRPDGTRIVKVLDFGIAKAPGDTKDFSLTQTANVIGSPGYMSPEQLKSSKVVDARADIWSLGIVMYELMTARQPFVAETITELTLRVAMDPTPQLPRSVPAPFAAAVMRCLEKDPARRFHDVGALAAALAPFAANGADAARRIATVIAGGAPIATVPPAPAAPTTLRSATGTLEQPARRGNRAVLFGAIGGGAAIGVVAMVLAMSGGGGDGSTPAPATAPRTVPIEATPPPEPPTAKREPEPAKPEPAPVEPAKQEPAPKATAKAPAVRPKPRPTTTPKKPTVEDVGASRK